MNGWTTSTLVLALAIGCSACHKDHSSLSAADSPLFKSAPAEVQNMWQAATTAAKTNGYATAYLTLMTLRMQQGLTPQQVAAVDEVSTAVNQRMYDAAAKGDAGAQAAIKEIRQSRRDR